MQALGDLAGARELKEQSGAAPCELEEAPAAPTSAREAAALSQAKALKKDFW